MPARRDLEDRIAALTAQIATLEDERRILAETLASWTEAPWGTRTGGPEPVSEPGDTEPGVPRKMSSKRMRAVRLPEDGEGEAG